MEVQYCRMILKARGGAINVGLIMLIKNKFYNMILDKKKKYMFGWIIFAVVLVYLFVTGYIHEAYH